MKLQFKHQKFQADAAKAVVDVFAGQPYLTPTYMIDRGYEKIEADGVKSSQIAIKKKRILPAGATNALCRSFPTN